MRALRRAWTSCSLPGEGINAAAAPTREERPSTKRASVESFKSATFDSLGASCRRRRQKEEQYHREKSTDREEQRLYRIRGNIRTTARATWCRKQTKAGADNACTAGLAASIPLLRAAANWDARTNNKWSPIGGRTHREGSNELQRLGG